MHRHPWIIGSGWALLAVAGVFGCRKQTTPKLEVKSEATETLPDGKRVTKSESTQIGSTLVKQSETTARGAAGSGKSVVNTYVGTVVGYTAGQSIDVLTGENDRHRVDLSGKDTTVDADPSLAIGNKVRLVDARDEHGRRTVTISPAR